MDGSSNYATMHVVVKGDAHTIKHNIRGELKEHGIVHTTLELESENEHCHEQFCVIEHEHSHSHHHHHHHHADDVVESFGVETARKFTAEDITAALEAFVEDDSYGMILRAKGIVASIDGEWIHFDYVPAEPNVRHGAAGVIGRLCVIGSNLDNDKIKEIFGL